MHYLLLTFSLIMHYLYRYICNLNVFIYLYRLLSAIKNIFIIINKFGIYPELQLSGNNKGVPQFHFLVIYLFLIKSIVKYAY